jgi:ribosomal-protein-alanine N-acetyltransferase
MIPVNPSANASAQLRAGLQVRPATSADHAQIADLTFFESHIHRHLDWRTPLEWLGNPPYLVLEDGKRIAAALACPPDPDSIYWIRLFAHVSQISASDAWSPLWSAARAQLAGRGPLRVAAISIQPWFDSLLARSGFDLKQYIVLLDWNSSSAPPPASSSEYKIRTMTIADLPYVVDLDSAAFEPLWRNSLNALSKAFSQSVCATLIEDEHGMAGYQISTGNSLGAHLARLAVRPDAQGRGLGAALVNDLIARMRGRGAARITVNTQADNASSLALYERLGFRRTGEQYPVYSYHMEA